MYNKTSENMSEVKNANVQTIVTSPPYYNKRTYGVVDWSNRLGKFNRGTSGTPDDRYE